MEDRPMALAASMQARNFPLVLRAFLLAVLLGTVPGRAGGSEIESAERWTVLTLASDGSWGTATDAHIGRAIAFARRNCRLMSERSNSCGAKFTSIRAGWSIAVRCGDEPIIAAASERDEAERIADQREVELRQVYRRDMPRCVRVVTVDPAGSIITPSVRAVGRR
jgi:hypothetical protein